MVSSTLQHQLLHQLWYPLRPGDGHGQQGQAWRGTGGMGDWGKLGGAGTWRSCLGRGRFGVFWGLGVFKGFERVLPIVVFPPSPLPSQGMQFN